MRESEKKVGQKKKNEHKTRDVELSGLQKQKDKETKREREFV